MPRPVTIQVYKFSELSEAAKQTAKDKHAEACGYSWATEAKASITKLAEHFGGKVRDYSIDWFNSTPSSMDFSMPEMDEVEIAERLATLGTFNEETGKGNGDCVLTGFCMDEDAIDGFRAAFKSGERDLEALMDAAYESWIESAQSDCASQYEDEQFAENCEANDYEFYENGRIARK